MQIHTFVFLIELQAPYSKYMYCHVLEILWVVFTKDGQAFTH